MLGIFMSQVIGSHLLGVLKSFGSIGIVFSSGIRSSWLGGTGFITITQIGTRNPKCKRNQRSQLTPMFVLSVWTWMSIFFGIVIAKWKSELKNVESEIFDRIIIGISKEIWHQNQLMFWNCRFEERICLVIVLTF